MDLLLKTHHSSLLVSFPKVSVQREEKEQLMILPSNPQVRLRLPLNLRDNHRPRPLELFLKHGWIYQESTVGPWLWMPTTSDSETLHETKQTSISTLPQWTAGGLYKSEPADLYLQKSRYMPQDRPQRIAHWCLTTTRWSQRVPYLLSILWLEFLKPSRK